ncbi:hypothetical protein M408DRAFT_331247 [Serendipita vermifera MAFF 305830]|uniref:Major facilitator superfamily (MFS) profile domain-containing protein n=1 Tax=Serendipita vermifera MAFF 305830 TaxID=933852 RepID=A0A0C3AZA8_SERVB|nr:hypothetical protein M408DRAFT_331247 [Serendipita vermifera MAFF 305830]
MPQFLEAFPEAKDPTIQGTLIATILMAAALASLSSGSVSNRISRKRTILIGAAVAAVGCFIEAASVKFWMLIIGRFIAGLGEGWFLNPISVYLIEISPPAVRGTTACTLQLLITIGIVIGYFMCYGSVSIQSSLSFRIPFIVQGVVCSTLALGTYLIPYSPRWLITKGREEEAWEIIAMFDSEGADHQREKIEDAIRREQEHQQQLARERETATLTGEHNNGVLISLWRAFNKNEHIAAVAETFEKGPRSRTIFGIALMGLQQLSGIDGVLFYAPVLFAQAGLNTQKASFLASGVSGIINFLCTIPAQVYLMDKWGRRPSCITGGLVMCVCMVLIGAMYASGATAYDGGRWTVIVLIYILTTEMQPARTRATASALAQTSNWLVNVVVALTTPIFLSKSPSGPYFMFGGFLLFTSGVCVLWAPETLGKTLEDIDSAWDERLHKTKQILHPKKIGSHPGEIELSSTIGAV